MKISGMLLSLIALRIAGRVEDLKKKHPDLSEKIDELADQDPTSNKKYIDWSVKQLLRGHSLNDIIPTVKLFNRKQKLLKKKDINQYEDLKELEDILKNLPESKRQEKIKSKTSGSTKLYEDDKFLLVRVDEKQACIEYGAGTKWCIVMKSVSYYEQYKVSNVVFYFLINKKPTEEETKDGVDKLAYAVQRGENNEILKIEIYKADDKTIDSIPYKEIEPKVDSIIKQDAPNAPEGSIMKLKRGELSQEEAIEAIEAFRPSMREYEDEEGRMEERYDDDELDSYTSMIDLSDPKYLPNFMDSNIEDVRRQVVRRIDPKYLPEMMNDKDKYVKMEAIKRIDPDYLPEMIKSFQPKGVLYEIAKRIHPDYLPEMTKDADIGTLIEIVKRIDPSYLPEILKTKYKLSSFEQIFNEIKQRLPEADEILYDIVKSVRNPRGFEEIHFVHNLFKLLDKKYLPEFINYDNDLSKVEVAKRIEDERLPEMMNDKDPNVRASVADRIDAKYLPEMMKDLDEGVFHAVAKRIDSKYLPEMMELLKTLRNTKHPTKYSRNHGELVNAAVEIAKRIDKNKLNELKDFFWPTFSQDELDKIINEREKES